MFLSRAVLRSAPAASLLAFEDFLCDLSLGSDVGAALLALRLQVLFRRARPDVFPSGFWKA